MCTLTLNNETFNLTSFNHQITIIGDVKTSMASCNIKNTSNEYNIIDTLTSVPITSFIVRDAENQIIYNLNNITAHISATNAYLSNNEISLDITLQFE